VVIEVGGWGPVEALWSSSSEGISRSWWWTEIGVDGWRRDSTHGRRGRLLGLLPLLLLGLNRLLLWSLVSVLRNGRWSNSSWILGLSWWLGRKGLEGLEV